MTREDNVLLMLAALGAVAMILVATLAGCASPPRLIQGDSTNNAWYASAKLAKF
jgi:starvation-inducible outer membrane lipoprotein